MKFQEQLLITRKAADLAKEKFKHIKRKDGKPYFSHLEAVANIIDDDYYNLIPAEAREVWSELRMLVIAVGYLHDIIEDTDVTMQDLADMGFPPLVYETVEILSRRKGETYFDFIMRINDSGAFCIAAKAVKLADLRHNMSDLSEGSMKDKYRLSEYILSYFNRSALGSLKK